MKINKKAMRLVSRRFFILAGDESFSVKNTLKKSVE